MLNRILATKLSLFHLFSRKNFLVARTMLSIFGMPLVRLVSVEQLIILLVPFTRWQLQDISLLLVGSLLSFSLCTVYRILHLILGKRPISGGRVVRTKGFFFLPPCLYCHVNLLRVASYPLCVYRL